MATYFSFTEKALACLGLQLNKEDRKFDRFLRIFCMTIVLLALIQSILYLITADKKGLDFASAFTITLVSLQGCFKLGSILLNFSKLKLIKKTLKDMMDELKVEEDFENRKKLRKFRKCMKFLLLTYFLCTWIFNLMPMVEIVFSTLSGSKVVKKLTYSFYYPSASIKTDYFYMIYLYETVASNIFLTVSMITDGFILLLIGEVVCLHRTIGKDFTQIINDYEPSKPLMTKEKLINYIKLQNEVFKVGEELIRTYEVALLVCFVMQTGIICFVAYNVVVRTLTFIH